MSVIENALRRVERVSDQLSALRDGPGWDRLADMLVGSESRWFFDGAGRSGLVASMAGMRFTQAGLSVYVVGNTTTPAIGAGDVLVALSRSGETPLTVQHAQSAVRAGARIVAVTCSDDSKLARLADLVVMLPNDPARTIAENVSDQLLLGLFDAVCEMLPGAHAMETRHANLE